MPLSLSDIYDISIQDNIDYLNDLAESKAVLERIAADTKHSQSVRDKAALVLQTERKEYADVRREIARLRRDRQNCGVTQSVGGDTESTATPAGEFQKSLFPDIE